ncbi:MAG: glycosyltransferase family 39 protein [Acidobacteria bacterium]|nr:glycosyltransferase family 39 protein [Acidobacteriota bacterium]
MNAAPLFDRDEGFYSEVTREMLERSDFISPYLNGQAVSDKPIFLYWMQAAGVEAFGLNEIGIRVSSAIAASIWVFATYFFARRYFSPVIGLTAALTQATSVFVIIIGRQATAEAWLNLFLALAFFDIYRSFVSEDGSAEWKWAAYRVYLWVGLGFLTKGPVALVLPFGAALLFAIFRRNWRPLLQLAFQPLGWLIFLASAAPWYVAQTMRDGGKFVSEFFLQHNLGRFEQPFDSHAGSFLYYVPMAFLLVLPYTTGLLRAAASVGAARRDPLALYLWLWFAFTFVFFSLSSSKLPHYLLYGMTPIFILIAAKQEEFRGSRIASVAPVIATLALLFALRWILPLAERYTTKASILARIADAEAAFGLQAQVLLGIALLAVIALLFVKRVKTWRLLPIAALIQAAALIGVVLPRVGAILQKPTVDTAQYLTASGLPDAVLWDLDAPSLSFYRKQVTPSRPPRSGEAAVISIDKLRDIGQSRILFQEGAVAVIRVDATEDGAATK